MGFYSRYNGFGLGLPIKSASMVIGGATSVPGATTGGGTTVPAKAPVPASLFLNVEKFAVGPKVEALKFIEPRAVKQTVAVDIHGNKPTGAMPEVAPAGGVYRSTGSTSKKIPKSTLSITKLPKI